MYIMSEELEYNPDLYTLVDEEGVEQTSELLDVMEVDDDRYFALIPYTKIRRISLTTRRS